MNKLTLILTLLSLPAAAGIAQQSEAELLKQLDTINTGATPAPVPVRAKAADDPAQKPPTEITATKGATYEEKTHKAVFTGDVHVNDPQFKIICDKLTAFLRDSAASGGGAAAKASPDPKSSPTSKPGDAPAKGGGGLRSAIAEGNVTIIQDKPAQNGGEAEHNVGKAQRADYDADSGDVTLKGMPQVQQGVNTQIATDDSTVMIMNRDGRTMKTIGPSKTLIQDNSDTNSKKK
ncbi:MAG: hypothetical protein QOD99_1899 [Chthoniobacter sp.]|jgi:lipopolysaccharide export system protein LptA|nr:hypothetical protein [Chthoniobacter sp.]